MLAPSDTLESLVAHIQKYPGGSQRKNNSAKDYLTTKYYESAQGKIIYHNQILADTKIRILESPRTL